MFILFLILGIASLAGAIGLLVWKLKPFFNDYKSTEIDKNLLSILLGSSGLYLVAGLCLQLGINSGCGWNLTAGESALSLIGAPLFFLFFGDFWTSFLIRHYKVDLDAKQAKINNILVYVLPFLALAGFLMLGEGVALHLTYPLVSGFCLGNGGFHWVTYSSGYSGFHLAWYAIVILLGAFLAYKLSDSCFYKEYKKHGIIDSLFVIALLGGILGARIWYVVGNFAGDNAGGLNFAEQITKGNWVSMFQLWNGGLTILGGAVAGIIVGMLYITKKRKYVDLRFAVDACVPTILLAQAIGRWGNFFNHEVYGAEVSMSTFSFLPTWLRYQMGTGFANGMPSSTQMYVPLFLIEGVANIIGYFIIVKLIPLLWPENKGRAKGDNLAFYLIWYGIVRIIMEPLRNASFNMGGDGMWSIWNSAIYIILGALALVAFQLIGLLEKKKGLPNQEKTYSVFYMILEAAFFGVGVWFLIDGIIKSGGQYGPAYVFVLVLGVVLMAVNVVLFYFSLRKFRRIGNEPPAEPISKLEDESAKNAENKGE